MKHSPPVKRALEWRRSRKNSRLSLFYRENRRAIERGTVPERYLRVVSQVTGPRVLEMGAAEGTLSLLLASRGRVVVGVEPKADRAALAVRRTMAAPPPTGRLSFVFGDIRDHLPLLQNIDTFVGMRCIYYLRHDIERVFEAIAKHVPEVVLTGNAEREAKFVAGERSSLGDYERYATLEGMISLVVKKGYRVIHSEAGIPEERDPMVVARLNTANSADE